MAASAGVSAPKPWVIYKSAPPTAAQPSTATSSADRDSRLPEKGSLDQRCRLPIFAPSVIAPIATMHSHSIKTPFEGDAVVIVPLSAWDQAAMRSYMRVGLCFPFKNGHRAASDAADHLQAALVRLALQRPDFAGELVTGIDGNQGKVSLRMTSTDTISFELVHLEDEFGWSYDDLRLHGFPPSPFIHPRFSLAHRLDQGPVPVAAIKAFVIRGGLLLSIFFHHSIADGECLRMFLESFAAQTRRATVQVASQLQLASALRKGGDPAELVARLPEYALLPSPSGPTVPHLYKRGVPLDEIKQSGRVFVFSNDQLRDLRIELATQAKRQKPPSNYTCLAALAWVHISRARQQDIEYVPRLGSSRLARLRTMVNWKRRLEGNMYREYFGNSTAVATTESNSAELNAASADLATLAQLVYRIEAVIKAVDDDFVSQRTAFFEAVQDPRLIGLAHDPRSADDLAFNTWRYFGADTAWDIPGTACSVPDAIRKTQESWGLSGALILPAKESSQVHELQVALPASSMALLLQDKGWMERVAKVLI